MQENPVLNREVRGRWRRPLTPIVFFGYAAALAVVAGAYCSANLVGNMALMESGPRLGQDLFLTLGGAQLILASLFAAALTAPSIAAERESGALVMLRLAPLSMRRVVFGKYSSAVLMVLLLVSVQLPMGSIAFVLGGVSAPDFCAVLALQLASGLFCSSLGLLCSAAARTSAKALGAATFLTALSLAPSVILLTLLNEPGFVAISLFAALAATVTSVGGVFAAASITAREFNDRPFLPEALMPAPRETVNETTAVVGESGGAAAKPVAVKKPRRFHRFRALLVRPPARDTRLTPIGRALQSTNPVFQHQLRTQLRLVTEAPVGSTRWRFITALMCWILWNAFWMPLVVEEVAYGGNRMAVGCLSLTGAVLVVLATLGGATSFIRERSQNMLASLVMTSLSPREVAGGKRNAAVVAAACYLLLSLPLYLVIFYAYPLAGVICLGLLLAILVWAGSLGVFCAWLCPSPGVAVAMALMCMFTSWAAIALLYSELQRTVRAGTSRLLGTVFRPLFQLLLDPYGPGQMLLAAAIFATCLLGLCTLLLWPVRRGLRPSALERDGDTWLNRDLSKTF